MKKSDLSGWRTPSGVRFSGASRTSETLSSSPPRFFHSAAEPQAKADSSLRGASLGMTCYSECYMRLRPTHRDEVDSSLILSAATIGFSSRLATSLPISATEHGVSSVSSLFRLCRSQSTRTRFGRGGSLAPCGRRPPQARGFPRAQVHTPFS